MTLHDRAHSYAMAFAKFPASHLRVVKERGGDVLYGTWLLGNDYRTQSALYGAYPKGYLDRVLALYPDVTSAPRPRPILHAFSGSVPCGDWVRVDSVKRQAGINAPEVVGDLSELPDALRGYAHSVGKFALVLADPPYSSEDAAKYGTPMVNRGKAMTALWQVSRPGAHLAWLDCVWPMHRKLEWRTCGRIAIVRSTNHRVRLLSIFERSAA